jgi:peroxin-6
MLKAITRQAKAVDDKISRLPGGPISTAQFFDHYASKEDIAVMVTEDDFVEAQRELVGSVSAKELEHYRRVQQSFESTEGESNNRAMSTSQRSISQSNSEMSMVNGKSKAKAKGFSGHRAHSHDENSDDSPAVGEDLVIKTDHLEGNGTGSTKAEITRKSKGKGLANGLGADQFIDTSQNDDEELYS